ncbi:hypothetical protein ENSA5_21540 [Enhygromyxa salina]|uniref:DUF2914 domain-containing protein n=1 Tax=Enhygromyxa salina TaxID=215803 RepID=A0A2S9YBN7_9BACT|nr:DUF2914 domain-containing protein [Enhygromyxa salina]PRQ02509.1 hypothetical protein ENSA5_21540 [Enhygromyxa salina]
MRRLSLPTVSCLSLLTTVICASPLACDVSSDEAQATEATSPVEVTADETARAEPAPVAAPVAAPVTAPVAVAPIVSDQPVLASSTPLAASSAPSAPRAVEPALERRTRAPDSLRSPSLLPDGTPEAHIAAFTNLPLAKRDKAPVGGVGATGIHLDELEVGKGWASSRCEELGTQFVASVDQRVNVCFRVVHPREHETVILEWSRAGKLRQQIELNVKATHAYLTRAWMPVSSGRAGDWTATVKSADGSVLGQVAFEISG